MSGMKRLQAVVLAVCLTLLSVIGTNAVEVHGDIEDTFIAEITNTLPNSSEQKIDCTFKVLEEPGSSGKGKVQVGDGTDKTAINENTQGSIEIPNEVKDSATNHTYTVTSLGKDAFSYCNSLTSTGLEGNNTIESIGEGAFFHCIGLTNTGLENNSAVTSLGKYAFSYCNSLTSTGLEGNNTIESLGDSAFFYCRSLKSTGLENNSTVKSIGFRAFSECGSLASTGLKGNSSVESIGDSAFYNCSNLTSTGLENNSTVKSIGSSAFSRCGSLTSTGLEKNSMVKSIGDDAFSFCSSLKSTGLENNSTVTSIGSGVFSPCSNLTSTGLENNSTIESIGKMAFSWCSSLKNVTLSKDSKVATIGDQAFWGCSSLKSFVIKGDKVPNFGSDVFLDAPSGFAIYYPVHVTNGSVAADPGKQIDNSFAKGTEVTITADAAEGKKFKNWSVGSGNVSLADRESASTTFAMPEEVVKVTANYDAIQYTVTVGGGTGGGKYVMNDTVTITADPAPEGKRFKEWQVVGGKAVLADPTKETTTFTMPAGNVEVKAVYEDISAGHEGETTPPGNDGSANPDTPQTSDPSNPGLLLFIMLGAGITAVVSYRTRKKKAQ